MRQSAEAHDVNDQILDGARQVEGVRSAGRLTQAVVRRDRQQIEQRRIDGTAFTACQHLSARLIDNQMNAARLLRTLQSTRHRQQVHKCMSSLICSTACFLCALVSLLTDVAAGSPDVLAAAPPAHRSNPPAPAAPPDSQA